MAHGCSRWAARVLRRHRRRAVGRGLAALAAQSRRARALCARACRHGDLGSAGVGSHFWALAPRSGVLVIFGVWLLLFMSTAAGRRAQAGCRVAHCRARGMGGRARVRELNDPQQVNGALNAAAPASATSATTTAIDAADWPAYGRTQEGTRYSPLQQITPDNVKNLQAAWTFRTGDLKGPNDPVEMTNEVTPIKIGDLLYLCSAHQILFALDAKTGTLKWKFDPKLQPIVVPARDLPRRVVCRSVGQCHGGRNFACASKRRHGGRTRLRPQAMPPQPQKPRRCRGRLYAPHLPAGQRRPPLRARRADGPALRGLR